MSRTSRLTRRTFLKTATVAGGGFMIGTYLPMPGVARTVSAAGVLEPNVWIQINADDSVRIMLTMLEMGQGVMTSMPMLVAEELDFDWSKIKTEWAPADARYGNPNFGGQQLTAGSNSVRGMWKVLRESGAAARAMLVTAAAQTWSVPENTLTTDKGEVIHQASGRRVKYGALVDKASTLPVPKTVTLKDPKAFKVLGQSLARLDVPDKVNGTAVFGIDVKLPGLLTARVVRCPVFGGKVASFNADKAKAIKGVTNVVQISGGVAVVADTYWAASQGAQLLEVKWDEGALAALNSAAIRQKQVELAQQPGKVARNDGNADTAFTGATRKFERTFEAPFLAHACMEPMNCTADVRADRCDVYVPTQGQTASQQAAMQASGLPADKVKIHTTFMGGGFGRRGEGDFVMDAVETSKAVGKPVKVVWTREDDIQHDYYRPVSYARMWGAVDGSGKPTVFMQRLVQQSLMKRIGGLPPNGVDFISLDGAANLPYDIPNVKMEYIEHDPGIPFGFWRSVGASFQGFVIEAFIDELATTAGKDPYQFRHDLLAKAPRHRAVLDLAAQKAGWGTPLPQGRARGIAVMECFGSILSQVTEVSVNASGAVKVHKIVCSVDTGWVINPDTIKAQMEGGIVYGLTAALKGEITIEKGRVVQRHFNDYQMLRHNEMPEIEVFIVPSTETPGGIGEPSTALAAGSLVNAIAAATGKRIYKLPIRAEQLRGGTA
ncbi:MAG TPA: xanthine dehydrogenase family protein molybdopterin-binding subunit [Vicinamibacterales bacterium]|nr:xanthine dehydrogenase family protein molybdopterin-binding subunit [Vicinamibacterales bacterium]